MASSEFSHKPDTIPNLDKGEDKIEDRGAPKEVEQTRDIIDTAVNLESSALNNESASPGQALELLDEAVNSLQQQAMVYFQQAYRAQQQQHYEQAITLYQKSINTYPTAEAHTFLGWVYSFQQRWQEAIAECHRAIAVDSTFGNPYNDIGAYLIEQGDYLGAIPWLKRALAAPRYECYFYPHCNLGRIYERQKQYLLAMQAYSQALQLNPRYATALQGIRRLQKLLN